MLVHITTALTVLNIVLLVVLIALNVRSYLKLKAQYTLFLLILAGIFLVENLFSASFLLTNMQLYVPQVCVHILVLTALETIAFSILIWMELQ